MSLALRRYSRQRSIGGEAAQYAAHALGINLNHQYACWCCSWVHMLMTRVPPGASTREHSLKHLARKA